MAHCTLLHDVRGPYAVEERGPLEASVSCARQAKLLQSVPKQIRPPLFCKAASDGSRGVCMTSRHLHCVSCFNVLPVYIVCQRAICAAVLSQARDPQPSSNTPTSSVSAFGKTALYAGCRCDLKEQCRRMTVPTDLKEHLTRSLK